MRLHHEQKPQKTRALKPPKGYRTWLDYALMHVSFRDAYIDRLYEAKPGDADMFPYQMRAAALAELDKLRVTAMVKDTFPARGRRAILDDMKP